MEQLHSEAQLPQDDLARALALATPGNDEGLVHIGMVGDTYTILLGGEQTAGRFCLIDMHVPPGGGPAPHRHDFEETFSVLEGEIEVTFRGENVKLSTGATANIPANAPHSFRNVGSEPRSHVVPVRACGKRAVLHRDGSARAHTHHAATAHEPG